MRFEITVLGTGSARPTVERRHSAQVLNIHEQYYLVDCGEGTQIRLLECGINLLKINAVFISHLHGDHMYGLFPLISSMGIMGRKTPLTIFAPAPFGEVMECHYRWFDTQLPFELIYHEVDTRKNEMIFENKVMEVCTVPLRHRIPAAGYLFREKTPGLNVKKEAIERFDLSIAQINALKRGEDIRIDTGETLPNGDLTYTPYSPRSYAYCSDTQYSGKVVSIVEGVDLLYHEATFADDDKALAKETGHSTAGQAAQAASKAGAGRLLIGHISSRYKDDDLLVREAREVFPQTEMAVEKQTYSIPAVRTPGR